MRPGGQNGTVGRFVLADASGGRWWVAVVAGLLLRMASGGEVDDLRTVYGREVLRLGDSRVAALLDLAGQYTSSLAALQALLEQSASDLTKRGQIDEAVAAKGALDALVADSELVAAREMLQSTDATDEPVEAPGAGGVVGLGNVALASKGGVARCSLKPGEMIDGNSTRYTGSSGFASGTVPAVFEVEFPNVMRLRLVRITGLSNTANTGFHIVEFEAYCTLGLKAPPRKR